MHIFFYIFNNKSKKFVVRFFNLKKNNNNPASDFIFSIEKKSRFNDVIV